jgi:preprotein translocase subunit Sec61beta
MSAVLWISTSPIRYYGLVKAFILFVSNPESMSMKQEKVAMPMTSAGIIGFSPDVKISGMEIDPKYLVIAIAAIVVIVHVAEFAVR